MKKWEMRKVSEWAGHRKNTGVNRHELYMSQEHFASKTEEVVYTETLDTNTHTLRDIVFAETREWSG